MSKLEPLNVTAKPCPECGSASISLEDSEYDPQDDCMYDEYHCDNCGLSWSEPLNCKEVDDFDMFHFWDDAPTFEPDDDED